MASLSSTPHPNSEAMGTLCVFKKDGGINLASGPVWTFDL